MVEETSDVIPSVHAAHVGCCECVGASRVCECSSCNCGRAVEHCERRGCFWVARVMSLVGIDCIAWCTISVHRYRKVFKKNIIDIFMCHYVK